MAVNVIDTIKPKNNGTFPVVEAVDVKVTNELRLDAALNAKANQSDVETLSTAVEGKASQSDLETLSTAVSGKQDTLTTEQLTATNSGITSQLVTQIGTNTTAIAGKADTSALSSAAANLQSQIDSLITPVTQDAEVENARVNAGGTSFTTLKERLDDSEDQADTAFYATSKGNLESGSWVNGSKTADNRRLRTKARISAPTGSALYIDTKNLYVLVAQYETDSSEDATSTDWLHGTHTIVIEHPYFAIMIANAATWATSTAISVDDYNCNISCLKSDFSAFAKSEDVSLLNSKIVTANSDITAISQTIAVDAKLNIKWVSSYANGGLNLDGSLINQKYRVSSVNTVTYAKDIKITAKTGYKFGWVTDGTWKGWYTEATIPKNTAFKLQLAKDTEDTSEIADIDTFINSYTTSNMLDVIRQESSSIDTPLISYTSWLQGTIAETGGINPTQTNRCRTADYIPYSPDTIIKLTDATYKYGIHFYNSSFTHLSNTDWINDISRKIDNVANCAYIKLVVAYSNNANITPTDIPDDLLKLSYSVKKYVDTSIENATSHLPFKYIGEKMPSVNYFDADSLFSMSYSGITSQDIDIYDTYMFVAFSGTEQIKIYSLTDYVLITSIEIPVHHGSGMQFSAEFYDPNDDFPLLYVGGWEDNLISVIRISRTTVDWTAEVIRTIKLPTTYGYYLSPSIDTKNNILYAYGHTNGSIPNTDPMMISKWNLSQLTDNGDNTYTPEYISSVESPSVGPYQGHKFLYNRLYVGASNTSSPFEPTIYAIDVNNGNIVSKVDLSPFLNEELEGVCYNFTNGRIEWYCSGYHPVFKLDFS